MRRILVRETGVPDVMVLEDVEPRAPGEGEALVKLEAVGVNFIDVNQRSGAYPMSLPFSPGVEGAGVVESTGAGVDGLAPGDRVAFAGVPEAYAEVITVRAERLLALPDEVTTESAAAVMLQGMTAHYLVASTCPLQEGDWCVVHAAAGGVGLLLTQLAKRRGARVVGTVSTPEKAERARASGADHVTIYTHEDVVTTVADLTGGAGVRAVFDSIGRDTFESSLRCLGRRGWMVLFGQASGPVDPVDPRRLQQGGSLVLTRPALADHVATRAELVRRGQDVLSLVASGELRVHVHGRYALEEASEAHRALESRTTTGKLLLVP